MDMEAKQRGGLAYLARVFALTMAASAAWAETHAAAPAFPSLQAITAMDSVLVVSPHPDDESLCCGGLIATARQAGAKVSIVWVTNGDAFKWDAMVVERKLRPRPGTYHALARKRVGEARAAASVLNVAPDSLYFLGYPDRGVLSLLFDYYYPSTPWRSKFTGDTAVAYEDAVDRGAEYDGDDLERDFTSIVDRVKPTLVFAPSPQDTHPDHRGTGILVLRVMSARNDANLIRFWIVHGGRGWPTPRGYHPNLPQTIAPRGRGMQWEQFSLDASARAIKLRAIESHRSQTEVMNRVMESHVRTIELFSRTPVPPGTTCLKPEPCEFEDTSIIEKSGL
jgi:LmbE family N-acetylglucosaminyl deacetylase